MQRRQGSCLVAQVNWQTLWMTYKARDFRGIVTLIPLAVLMVFPIGLFSGKHLHFSSRNIWVRQINAAIYTLQLTIYKPVQLLDRSLQVCLEDFLPIHYLYVSKLLCNLGCVECVFHLIWPSFWFSPTNPAGCTQDFTIALSPKM